MSSTTAASGRGKRQKSKAYRSRTEKAGLIFPVGRIARFLKIGKYADRLSKDAPVYIAAVLEYMAIEVLELSGNLAKTNKKKQIGPREIQLAIRDDNELNKVVGNSIIPNAGVPPNIHVYLLPKIKGEKEVEIGSESKGH